MSEQLERLAQSVHARLLRHAKEIRADPNLVLVRYASERIVLLIRRTSRPDKQGRSPSAANLLGGPAYVRFARGAR